MKFLNNDLELKKKKERKKERKKEKETHTESYGNLKNVQKIREAADK